ncbi:MAG: PH domain-containing protein [Gaiellaceae bacterium]
MRLSSRERVLLETRQHGIVLGGSVAKALVLACAGAALLLLDWPWSAGGVVAMALAALVALRAAWRWDRTKIVLTSERLSVVTGVLGRRTASVALSSLGALEIEQTLTGRLLRYGTVIAGELEIDFVPDPAELQELITELAEARLVA